MKTLGILVLMISSITVFGQDSLTGTIRGTIIEKENCEPAIFCNLLLTSSTDSVFSIGGVTDLEGNFTFKNLPYNTYNLKISSVSYQTIIIEGIKVQNSTPMIVDVELAENQVALLECVVMKQSRRLNSTKVASMVTNRGSRRMRNDASNYSNDYNTEEYKYFEENGYKSVKDAPLSTLSIDVDKASYSNVRRYINEGSLPPVDAVRIEEMINYFDYHSPAPTDNVINITSEMTECPWNESHNLVMINMKGKEIDMGEAPKNNLVFLIDVSGSMDSPDKLDLLKSGLNLLVDQLRNEDKLSIVVYAGAAGVVLESTSGEQKSLIKRKIYDLSAGGSTAGGEGIKLAYKIANENFIENGNNRVILATDGDFNVGISSEGDLVRMIEKKRESNIFLSVLGFGRGNLKDNKMEILADKGNGSYYYIDDILEAKKVLVKELGSTLYTIAKDVKVQAEFNPNNVKSYRLIGYENRLLNDEDFNDDKKDAGELGAGHTVTILYEIIPANSKENENKKDIDDLKYQTAPQPIDNGFVDEVMTIKFRYKNPKEHKSNLLYTIVENYVTSFIHASENLRFAASVAAFGMLLRDSKYKKNATYENVIIWAKAAKGEDVEGYRSEFIRLVEKAELLANK